MYNFGKTIIGFFGIMFLVFGGVTLGQSDEQETDPCGGCPVGQECQHSPVKNGYICVSTSRVKCSNGKRIGSEAVGVCKCNDGYKNVDGECKSCSAEGVCCGIKLNTNVPFIGNCIELSKKSGDTPEGETDPNETRVTDKTAFPRLMGGLTKILVTIIILAGFIGILAGGVMISASGGSDEGAKKGKDLIIRVIIALALLGASGVILRLINPNFFG